MVNIAFIGMGEAGTALRQGLGAAHRYRWFDIDPARSQPGSLEQALAGAELIFSVVTAKQALPVAQAVAQNCTLNGALYLDGNSCAPQSKQSAAKLIEGVNGHYVDCAIVAPIHPRKHETPMSLSGPSAVEAHALCQSLNMRTENLGPVVGEASMTKMLRSIAVKGLEALTGELAMALEAAGETVRERVYQSLNASYPNFDWPERVAYNWERSTTHGIRRADELDEVCVTLEGLGIEPLTSRATAQRQRELGTQKPALGHIGKPT